jgi:ribosomal protein S18 acetylase RimI-like enzyme
VSREIRIRVARVGDDAELQRIDVLTCTVETTPAPWPDPGGSFFAKTDPANVLVAELDDAIIGYAKLGHFYEVPSSTHVHELCGFAVDPVTQRLGAGRVLLEATVEEARRRGARKLMLRVLGHNARAREVYEAGGFHVEGVLRAQFVLDGRDVDDVLMARELA